LDVFIGREIGAPAAALSSLAGRAPARLDQAGRIGRLGQLRQLADHRARPGPTPGPSGAAGGARGPLSAAQSKAILDRLASRGQDTSIFDRHLALEEAIVGSPLTTGNRVVLLQDGPATYRAMLSVILAAREQHQPGDLHPGRR